MHNKELQLKKRRQYSFNKSIDWWYTKESFVVVLTHLVPRFNGNQPAIDKQRSPKSYGHLECACILKSSKRREYMQVVELKGRKCVSTSFRLLNNFTSTGNKLFPICYNLKLNKV